jgi:hypothetical protein
MASSVVVNSIGVVDTWQQTGGSLVRQGRAHNLLQTRSSGFEFRERVGPQNARAGQTRELVWY